MDGRLATVAAAVAKALPDCCLPRNAEMVLVVSIERRSSGKKNEDKSSVASLRL